MADTTYWFATYEIDGTLTSVQDYDPSKSTEEREKQALLKYVQTKDPVSETQTSKWYFGAIEDELEFVVGQFGREYVDEPSRYDENEGVFIDQAGTSTDAEYSMFLLHYERNLLIYNTRDRVGHSQFLKHFTEGFSNIYGGRLQITLNPIRNEDELEGIIEESDVYEVGFELEPSNPSSDPEWEDLDESIQEMLAQELKIMAESEEGTSLNMDEELLQQAVEMAQTKYGLNYKLVYNDDGQVKTVTKDREPIRQKKERPDSLAELVGSARDLISYASSYLDQDG